MKIVTLYIENDFAQLQQLRMLLKSILVSQKQPEIIVLCNKIPRLGFTEDAPDFLKMIKFIEIVPHKGAKPVQEAYLQKLHITQYVEPPFIFIDADSIVSGEIPATGMDICVNSTEYVGEVYYGLKVTDIKKMFGLKGNLIYFNSGTVLVNNDNGKELYDLALQFKQKHDLWEEDEPYLVCALTKLREDGGIKVKYMDYMSTAWDLYEPLGNPDKKVIHHYHCSKAVPVESKLIARLRQVNRDFEDKFPGLVYPIPAPAVGDETSKGSMI